MKKEVRRRQKAIRRSFYDAENIIRVLPIEVVIADSEGKGTIFGNPVAGSNSGIHKEQNVIINRITLKTHLCGDNASLAGIVIYRTHRNG